MARLIYCHPSQTRHGYHVYTDLDFWDTRRILKGMATVKRNFGHQPEGDVFPTQVVGDGLSPKEIKTLERRLRRAIVAPPRHVVTRAVLLDGFFEFDPARYYPSRWSSSRVLFFTYHRLPLQQSALNSPYKTVRVVLTESKTIRIEQVRRGAKHDPVIRTRQQARQEQLVPSCF